MGQVAARRGDDARAQAHRSSPAESLEAALLEGAEQARLLRPLELSDLVQEEGAPRGALETPGAPADGAGEGAPFVPEELSLE